MAIITKSKTEQATDTIILHTKFVKDSYNIFPYNEWKGSGQWTPESKNNMFTSSRVDAIN